MFEVKFWLCLNVFVFCQQTLLLVIVNADTYQNIIPLGEQVQDLVPMENFPGLQEAVPFGDLLDLTPIENGDFQNFVPLDASLDLFPIFARNICFKI
jgi:hypothetical protein